MFFVMALRTEASRVAIPVGSAANVASHIPIFGQLAAEPPITL